MTNDPDRSSRKDLAPRYADPFSALRSEMDKEIVVEAELPGMDEKDISLALQDGVLTIRGEKKHEYDEEKENYRVMERRYGSFQRSLRLPDTVNEDKVEASFDNGVLKVIVPKRPEAIGKQRT